MFGGWPAGKNAADLSTLAQLRITDEGGIPVIAVDGEVDVANVASLRAQIVRAVPNTAPGLVLDLSRTSYLDSRGVHLILELADRMATSQQPLRVVVPEGALVRRVLLLTHVDAHVPLDLTITDAVARLQAAAGGSTR